MWNRKSGMYLAALYARKNKSRCTANIKLAHYLLWPASLGNSYLIILPISWSRAGHNISNEQSSVNPIWTDAPFCCQMTNDEKLTNYAQTNMGFRRSPKSSLIGSVIFSVRHWQTTVSLTTDGNTLHVSACSWTEYYIPVGAMTTEI